MFPALFYSGDFKASYKLKLWDGKTAERIVEVSQKRDF
jgi:hypothetical protein